MPPAPRTHPAPENNPPRSNVEEGNTSLDENASLEDWKNLALKYQVENTRYKQELTEKDRTIGELNARHGTKRRRREPSEPTVEDYKYEDGGKRCAVAYNLWVSPDLYVLETNHEYTEARRYLASKPEMQLQGERQDVFKSLPENCAAGLKELPHYQKVVFGACLFGPSAASNTPSEHRGGPKVLATKLGIKTVTPGAIAAAAVLTRWCISPDVEFQEVGPTMHIKWHSDYQQYKKLIHEGLRIERARYDSGEGVGPYTKLIAEWNSEFFPETREDEPWMREDGDEDHGGDDADITAALAEIHGDEHGNGDE
ncbi:unnamed protein product [Rhizoctonia solani]|uniref:Uncharacterized protein n=1 Tax=Rhizoctonia solani TaxID=456999 RepID=A0A8H3CQC9_9AGAM|nr:unnamed protein product [Rhizoctonia solani]